MLRDEKIAALLHHEFTNIAEGEVTLDCGEGAAVVIKASDSMVIPKATSVHWQQQGPLRRTFMVFADDDGPGEGAPHTAISLIQTQHCYRPTHQPRSW